MALPKIIINVLNGAIGAQDSLNDGVSGLIMSGVAIPTKIAVNEVVKLTSYDDALDLGISEAYDTANSVDAHRHIYEFYKSAPAGTPLYIMLTSPTETIEEVAATRMASFIEAAAGVKIIALSRTPDLGYTPVTTEGLDADVFTALVGLQSALETAATNKQPIRAIVEGRAYTEVPGDLRDLKTENKNRCQILIGGTKDDTSCSVGLLLGRYAADPVMRNPGRVKSGALNITEAYIGASTVEDTGNIDIGAIHEKGYVSLRTWQGKAGYFFTDDPMATSNTDDYSSFARGRVIDKAIRIANQVMTEEVLDEIPVDTAGNIVPGVAKNYQQNVTNAIEAQMSGEISSVSVSVPTDQNVIATGELTMTILIVPVGYGKQIEINLGYLNPALNS